MVNIHWGRGRSSRAEALRRWGRRGRRGVYRQGVKGAKERGGGRVVEEWWKSGGRVVEEWWKSGGRKVESGKLNAL